MSYLNQGLDHNKTNPPYQKREKTKHRNASFHSSVSSFSFVRPPTFYDEPANDVVEDEEEANATRAAPNGMGREVPRCAAEAVGAVRGGDSRPFHQGAALAGHLRHRRRGRTRLRPRRTCHARLTCAHELRLRGHHSRLVPHPHHLPRPTTPPSTRPGSIPRPVFPPRVSLRFFLLR